MQIQAPGSGFSPRKSGPKHPVVKPTNTSVKNVHKRNTRKNNIEMHTKLVMFSNNCSGLSQRKESLKNELKRTGSLLFTLQETHLSQKGKVEIESMQIYEAIRKKEHGIMLGAHVSLKPVLISEYSEQFEMLVVEIKVSNKSIRVITGYGPQENVSTEERMPFFATLEKEIVSAKLSNSSVLIQMDTNSKMGKDMVPNDTHEQTPNGASLAGLINRNDLIVVNSLKTKVKGSTTRKRITVDGVEESIIDFVIVSLDLVKDVESLLIDEQKEYALSKIVKRKNSVQVLHSDHHVMIASLSLS